MNTALFIGLVILVGVDLGWVLHQRAIRRMSPILTRLAAEMNGKVESSNLFLMPKLRFSHLGTEVEISSASTGIAGESRRYTYTKFIGFDFNNFEFRILPRSFQTIGDKWIRQKKPISIGVDKLDKRLSIYSNNEPLLKANPKPNSPEWWTMVKLVWNWKVLKKVSWVRVLVLGVIPEYRKLGIDALFYYKTALAANKKGMKMGEMSWILDNNDRMNRPIIALGGEVYKTYRFYEKAL
jgi:hypothetical protein